MTVCGNDARRGSVDCDLRGAQARETTRDGTPTLGSVIVSAPPAPCPCVVRVVSDDNAEIAVASITIVGHPVAEVVEPTEFVQPLEAEIDAVTGSAGFGDRLRSSLGGPTTYEVTVAVRNRTPTSSRTSGPPRRSPGSVTTTPGPFPSTTRARSNRAPPGNRWSRSTLRRSRWARSRGRSTVSGIGPPVEATDATSSQPIVLYVVGAVLVLDLLVLVWRLARRRVATRRRPPANPLLDDPRPDRQHATSPPTRSGACPSSSLTSPIAVPVPPCPPDQHSDSVDSSCRWHP